MFKDEWKDLIIKKETIKVKGDTSRTIEVRYTHHGPLLEHMSTDIGKVLYQSAPLFPTGTFAFGWVGHKKNDTTIQKMFELIKCLDVECAVQKALE